MAPDQRPILTDQAVTMRDGSVLYTGGLGAVSAARQVAFNTVFHDARRLSRIILPSVD